MYVFGAGCLCTNRSYRDLVSKHEYQQSRGQTTFSLIDGCRLPSPPTMADFFGVTLPRHWEINFQNMSSSIRCHAPECDGSLIIEVLALVGVKPP